MGIPLGPFELTSPVGRGGMGVVWVGRHVGQDVPVAVKVITGRAASTVEYHRAFVQEVRAVSALDHPGVVWIFDSGTIPANTAAHSEGELIEGSPYLVMEYASHGTLRQQTRLLPWPEVHAILMSLLDALAHAHARGVLHRDLKPDNVLIAGGDDLRPGFKITDFGIARPLDDTAASEERPVGTPQYMAPEQIRNDTEQFGPHTDLYALGNLAWRLVTGKLPFHGMKGAPLMYAQLHRPPPALEPAIDVPSGIEGFLRTLLAKEPHDRFQRAADAALALAALTDARTTHQPPTFELEVTRRPTPGDRRPSPSDRLDLDTATLKIVVSQRPQGRMAVGAAIRPPFPGTWRLPPTASRPLRLMGAGLGLYGVRPVPLVGREPERDALWKALFDVHHEGRARAVVVRGPPGVGRTRLVQWVGERAHEVGGATVLKTSFTSTSTALDQMRRSLVRLLQSTPQSPAVRDERFADLFAAAKLPKLAVADAIDLLLDPTQMELPDPQRQVLLRRIWEILAADRPLLVVFDDAQWGPESLKLARHLLDVQETRPSRILVVATVVSDADGRGIEGSSEVGRLVDALLQRRGAQTVLLGPLTGEHRVDLVQELLGFDMALAQALAAATGGNPLFAVQLVADWVQRGKLAAGRSGFVLAAPDDAPPESIADVWEGRIRALVAGLEPPALELLERAAVLGREVDVLEWQAVCDDPDGRHTASGRAYLIPRHARLRQALMDRLLATKLAYASDAGFVFTHAQLREALLSRADSAGRLRTHAAAAAAVLVHRMSDPEAERVGGLLADAGQVDPALQALFRAEDFRRRTAGVAAAADVLVAVERTLKRSRVPKTHRGWAELAARRAQALARLGRCEHARRQAKRALERAQRGRWRDLEAIGASVLGACALAEHDHAAAEKHFLDAVRLLGDDGDVGATVRAWHRLRRLALFRGDRAEAHQRGERVRAALARATLDHDRAAGLSAVAEFAWSEGALEDARVAATEAAELFARHGDLRGEAKARATLAEVAEAYDLQGELDLGAGPDGSATPLERAREQWYRAVELLEAFGSTRHAILARCRLAYAECRCGHFDAARDSAEAVLVGGDPPEPRLRSAVHAVLALVAASKARWERFDTHLQVCEALYPTLQVYNPEYADVMALTGELALGRNQVDRARRAWALAELRYRALGASAAADTIRDRAAASERTSAASE